MLTVEEPGRFPRSSLQAAGGVVQRHQWEPEDLGASLVCSRFYDVGGQHSIGAFFFPHVENESLGHLLGLKICNSEKVSLFHGISKMPFIVKRHHYFPIPLKTCYQLKHDSATTIDFRRC